MAAVLGLVLALAGMLAWRVLAPGPDLQVEAIRRQGYPVTPAELDAWYRPVPADENAALLYLNAFAQPLFYDNSKISQRMGEKDWLPPRGRGWLTEDKAGLEAFLATNQATLQLLYAVPATNASRYPIDLTQGCFTLLSHLSKVKRAISVLSDEALLRASQGEPEEAVAALEAAGKVADSLAEEPVLISQLVRVAGWNILVTRLERVLGLTALSEAQLVRLQEVLAKAERPRALARTLAGERVCGLAVFTEPNPQALGLSSSRSWQRVGERFRWNLMLSLLKTTGLWQKDRAFYLEQMAASVAAAERPYPERFRLGEQNAVGAMNPPRRFMILSRMLLPALAKVYVRDAEHAARMRVAQAALAVERFRRAHGNALPAGLEALAPAYLNCALTDPFDGKLLRFKPRGAGYVLYSIGSDERDDGGVEPDAKHPKAAHDITFIVER